MMAGTYLTALLFLYDVRGKVILLEQWLRWGKVWVGDLRYLRKIWNSYHGDQESKLGPGKHTWSIRQC